MSFKSMESVLNLFNNNKPLRKQYSKESVIYSTELVNDMRKISKYDAFSKEFDDNLARISDEIDMISYSVEKAINELGNRYIIYNSLKSFSMEMANFYIHSVEEDNVQNEDAQTSTNKNENVYKKKNIFIKILEGLGNFFKKIASFFVGLYQKFRAFCSKVYMGTYAKTYKEFDPTKFQNMDATIKVRKLAKYTFDPSHRNITVIGSENHIDEEIMNVYDKMRNIIEEMMKITEESCKTPEGMKNNQSKLEEYVESEDVKHWMDVIKDSDKLKNDISRKYFENGDTKTREMTVGEYFNCKAGETPKSLFWISEKQIKTIQKSDSEFRKNIDKSKKAHNITSNIIKVLKNIKDDKYGTDAVAISVNVACCNIMCKYINNVKWQTSYEIMCLGWMLKDINTAVKAGLSSTKENESEKK